jgi:hypothetical protein
VAWDELRHGVEVYSQLLPRGASEKVVAKEELTVFETETNASMKDDLSEG